MDRDIKPLVEGMLSMVSAVEVLTTKVGELADEIRDIKKLITPSHTMIVGDLKDLAVKWEPPVYASSGSAEIKSGDDNDRT